MDLGQAKCTYKLRWPLSWRGCKSTHSDAKASCSMLLWLPPPKPTLGEQSPATALANSTLGKYKKPALCPLQLSIFVAIKQPLSLQWHLSAFSSRPISPSFKPNHGPFPYRRHEYSQRHQLQHAWPIRSRRWQRRVSITLVSFGLLLHLPFRNMVAQSLHVLYTLMRC